MKAIAVVQHLTKYYSERHKPLIRAVDDISFEVSEGEILGFLGPNGAGKTTTIQMMLGTLIPTSGHIAYFGARFTGQESDLKKRINYGSAYSRLPWSMTVLENLDIYARLYDVQDRQKRIKKLLTNFNAMDLLHKQIKQLSAGQMTRVILAKAFVNYPELVLLDEPTASLDPEIASDVRQFLIRQQQEYGVSMVFTSHNMREVESLCDRIIILNQGKIIAQGSPENLTRSFEKVLIRIREINDDADFHQKVQNLGGEDFHFNARVLQFSLRADLISKMIELLNEQKVALTNLEIIRPGLEDLFIEIAKREKTQGRKE